MFFCYVDESGDWGAYNAQTPDKTGSPYVLLAGVVVEDKLWRQSLDILKSFRRNIARDGILPYDVEFHCAELIDTHKIKEYLQISIPDRWKLISEFAGTIGRNAAFSIIAVVIDKAKSKINPEDYLTTSITKLYQAFDEFLKLKDDRGIVFFDRANERHTNTHVRSLMGTAGVPNPHIKISRILEDPIFRVSADSAFIQSVDVIVYTLKEQEFPMASRKKFNADRTFRSKLIDRCFKSQVADPDGIIRA